MAGTLCGRSGYLWLISERAYKETTSLRRQSPH